MTFVDLEYGRFWRQGVDEQIGAEPEVLLPCGGRRDDGEDDPLMTEASEVGFERHVPMQVRVFDRKWKSGEIMD